MTSQQHCKKDHYIFIYFFDQTGPLHSFHFFENSQTMKTLHKQKEITWSSLNFPHKLTNTTAASYSHCPVALLSTFPILQSSRKKINNNILNQHFQMPGHPSNMSLTNQSTDTSFYILNFDVSFGMSHIIRFFVPFWTGLRGSI